MSTAPTARRKRAGRVLASSAIGAYQRWVSPHKGFACACRMHEGRASCSAFARRAIGIHGLRRGAWTARRRLAHCGEVHRHVHGAMPQRPQHGRLQRGDCDPGCADLPCDLPGGSGGSGSSCWRLVDCSNCGCEGCGDCDDRRSRDLVAEWGPALAWVMALVLAVGLGVIAVGCVSSGCGSGAEPLSAWWLFFALEGLFAAVVLALRIRRDMPLMTTLALAPWLGLLAFAAAMGPAAWARWLGP